MAVPVQNTLPQWQWQWQRPQQPSLTQLPKQRGSSLWRFCFPNVRLVSCADFFITTNLTSKWRRHVVRYYSDTALQDLVMGRYTPTLLVLSLLLDIEIQIFFSPSELVTSVRHALMAHNGTGSANGDEDKNFTTFLSLRRLAGLILMASIVITFAALLANYTAMGVFETVHPVNAAIIYRSDVGLYAVQLPARLTVLALYLFVTLMCT